MSAHEAIPPDDPHRMAQAIAAIQASYVSHPDLLGLQKDLTAQIQFVNQRIDATRTELTETFNRRITEQNELITARLDAAVAHVGQSCHRWGIALVATLLFAVVAGLAPMYSMIFQMNRDLGALTIRADHLEAKMDRLDAKVDRLEARVVSLEAKVDKLDAKVDQLASDLAAIKAAVIKPAAPAPKPR